MLGTQLFASWRRLYFNGVMGYAIRTEGSFGYQYANDLTWSGGPGVFCILEHDFTTGLQATISGESKGNDTLNGVNRKRHRAHRGLRRSGARLHVGDVTGREHCPRRVGHTEQLGAAGRAGLPFPRRFHMAVLKTHARDASGAASSAAWCWSSPRLRPRLGRCVSVIRFQHVTLSDWQGDTAQLAAPPAGVMIIDFWASWCQPCRAALPELNAIAQRYAADGVQVVAVNIDKARAPADAFLKTYVPAPAMTLLRDPGGSGLARYGASGMPALYVVDQGGVVRLVESGFTVEKLRTVEALVGKLLHRGDQP